MAKLNTYALEDSEPWNMNKAFLMRLDRRLDERDVASIEGSLITWYRALRSIYANIHWKLKQDGQEEEEAKLDVLLKKADNFTKMMLSKTLQAEAMFNVEKLLQEIDVIMNDLIIEYDLIKLEKTQRDPSKAILEKFA